MLLDLPGCWSKRLVEAKRVAFSKRVALLRLGVLALLPSSSHSAAQQHDGIARVDESKKGTCVRIYMAGINMNILKKCKVHMTIWHVACHVAHLSP